MSSLRNILFRCVCTLGIAAFATAPGAQSVTALENNNVLRPIEIQILDPQLVPISDLNLVVNDVPVNPQGVGRFTTIVEGSKAIIQLNPEAKGIQPASLEVVLLEGKVNYVELCYDPASGAIKDVYHKVVTTRAKAGKKSTQVGAPSLTGGQSGPGGPANDNCANATPIGNGVTAFSTVGATTDGPDHPTVCQFGNGETVLDIWYVYTASCTGTLSVSTCGDADFDTDLVIYDGDTCGSLVRLACNDDFTGCAGFTSMVEAPVVMGNDYLIRVGGFGALGDLSSGTGNLTVSCTASVGPPANDECANAEMLPCNSTVTFDNSMATTAGSDPAFSCHFGGAAQGVGTVWYTFVPTGSSVTLDTDLSTDGDDSLIGVYSGTCGSLVEIACSEDEGIGLLSNVTVGGLTPGTTYYVQVAAFGAADTGEYVLRLTCDLPSAPANDACADAIAAAVPSVHMVNNVAATTDVITGMPCGVASGPFRNVWYVLTGTGGTIRASTCNGGTTNPDTKISVFCGSCGDATCVGGNDDSCVGFNAFNSTVDFCTQLGATYYVTVGDFSSTTGGGNIQLNFSSVSPSCTPTVLCLPQGACCLPDGSCDVLTADACAAAGGDYQGDNTACVVESVNDGGFELGAFGGAWTESSTNFGTPLCDLLGCGTGGGTPPFEGDWWAWFGGINALEVGSVQQSVTIAPSATDLTFYLDIPVSSGNGTDFLRVRIDGNIVFSVLENDGVHAGVGWHQVTVPLAPFNDGGSHTLRFESTVFGGGLNVSNFFVDNISIGSDAGLCETCVVIDFETDDDGVTPLVNGQALSTPPEFGTYFALSSNGLAQGPAVYDSTPGVNSDDDDLWISKGNVLINQANAGMSVPDVFNAPNDCSCGGTFYFDFVNPVELQSLVLADVDNVIPPQDAYITLIDSAFNTRTYHAPSGYTEKISVQGGTGWRSVDLTTLAAQPGFAANCTAVEDAGFQADDVVRMEIHVSSSAAIDDIEFCF